MAGWEYRSLEGADTWLVAGPDGVGLLGADRPVTVRFDRCAAVLSWPDGRRTLIGEDAVTVTVEPTLFARAATAPPIIDAAVPPELTAPMPARDPSEIPQPDPTRYGSPATAPAVGRRLWRDSGVVGFGLLLLLAGPDGVLCRRPAVRLGEHRRQRPGERDDWADPVRLRHPRPGPPGQGAGDTHG